MLLKDIFSAGRVRVIAREFAAAEPGFDRAGFLRIALHNHDDLGLLTRLRRVTDGLRAALPGPFPVALEVLRRVAPRTPRGLASMYLPDFVGRHGLGHFRLSMRALREFTILGSSEFGIRPFLEAGLSRTLAEMEKWTRDSDEHVRRLASEGCRPRLPWARRLDALVADPEPVAGILEALKSDPSPYVRKSVANHLNDISKDHPDWVFARLERWDLTDPRTRWIARHALRNLIKAGDPRALALMGAGDPPRVVVRRFAVGPRTITTGQAITLRLDIASASSAPQCLIIDYAIHYVKKSGAASPKVFKWKNFRLEPGGTAALAKSQVIRDFSTRKHYPGSHRITVTANGTPLAAGSFVLRKN